MMIKFKKWISYENLVLLLFTAGSIIFFSLFYYHKLSQREQTQLFQLTGDYFLKSLSVNGGLSGYLGEFFTQFFAVPAVGGVIITFLLVALQLSMKKLSLRVTGSNSFSILAWIPSLIYFFLITREYYYISGIIGLIITAFASSYYLKIRKKSSGIVAGLCLITFVYWVAGGAYLVLILNIFAGEFIIYLKGRNSKSFRILIRNVIILVITGISLPFIAHRLLVTDTLLQSFISEAYYAIKIFFPLSLIIVFSSVPVIFVIYYFITAGLSERQFNTINIIFGFLAGCLTTFALVSIPDYRGEKVLAYEDMVNKEQWGSIMRKAEKEQPSDQISLAAINLALASTGQLTTLMFNFDQKENDLFISYERKGMTPFMASEPYFHLGLINYSQMFAMETIESTVDAKLPVRAVKRVAETYLLNGQFDIASRYCTILSHTLFYGRWAKRYLDLIKNGEDIGSDPMISEKKKIMPKYDFFYDYRKMDIPLRYLLISNPDNKMAFEYLMSYYLLKKDFDGFLQNISLIKRMDYKSVPVAFQEAAAYVLTRLQNPPEELQELVTDQTAERLKAYALLYGTSRQDTARMKREFGSTYWYYLHYK